jgi:hypothetical protein
MSDETTDPEVTQFLRRLASAAPSAGRLDRDAVLFAAGRASRVKRLRAWQLTTGVLAIACAGLGSALAVRTPDIIERERVVYVEVPASKPAVAQIMKPAEQDTPQSVQAASASPEEPAGAAPSVYRGITVGSAHVAGWNGIHLSPLSEREVPEITALPAYRTTDSGDSLR